MKISEFQEYVKDRLNAVEAHVQGGCKAIAEDTLNVTTEIETQLQTASGVAIVVTTPNFKRNGCTADGISVDTLLAVKCIEQSATKSSAGDLKAYKDQDGNNISVYVTDRHKEYSFEAIIAAGVNDKQIGETATVGGITGVITKWDVTESNEDVKKVSVGIRNYEGLNG